VEDVQLGLVFGGVWVLFFRLFFHYSFTSLFFFLPSLVVIDLGYFIRISRFLSSVFSLSLCLFLYCRCSLSGYFCITYYSCGVSPNLTSYVLLVTINEVA